MNTLVQKAARKDGKAMVAAVNPASHVQASRMDVVCVASAGVLFVAAASFIAFLLLG